MVLKKNKVKLEMDNLCGQVAHDSEAKSLAIIHYFFEMFPAIFSEIDIIFC